MNKFLSTILFLAIANLVFSPAHAYSLRLADIAAVNENPVCNIKMMEKVTFVMKEVVV